MIPILTPVILRKPDESEYRRERILFAEMQMEFHARKAEQLRGMNPRGWIVGLWGWFELRRLRQRLQTLQ